MNRYTILLLSAAIATPALAQNMPTPELPTTAGEIGANRDTMGSPTDPNISMGTGAAASTGSDQGAAGAGTDIGASATTSGAGTSASMGTSTTTSGAGTSASTGASATTDYPRCSRRVTDRCIQGPRR